MSIRILTSMFPQGFPAAAAELFRTYLPKAASFAFVASEFERGQEKTDRYFQMFLHMFREAGMEFSSACIVDGRMSPQEAQKTVAQADVVWLSGGDTPVEFRYFQQYGLVDGLRHHPGVVIGMSAGSINMAETALCTRACGHAQQEIYPALGCVPFSVEPHFVREKLSTELLDFSEKHVIYGLCDNGMIVYDGAGLIFSGEVYRIAARTITLVGTR